MIIGTGTDIVQIPRIERLYRESRDRFVSRILVQEEIDDAPENELLFPAYLAKRFAAKEALSKALGTGIGSQLSFQDILIQRLPSGKPVIGLTEKVHELALSLIPEGTVPHFHLSLADDYPVAQAMVVFEAISQ